MAEVEVKLPNIVPVPPSEAAPGAISPAPPVAAVSGGKKKKKQGVVLFAGTNPSRRGSTESSVSACGGFVQPGVTCSEGDPGDGGKYSVIPPSGASGSFHELLQQLGQEHERSLLTLHQENAKFREMLGLGKSGSGGEGIYESEVSEKETGGVKAKSQHMTQLAPPTQGRRSLRSSGNSATPAHAPRGSMMQGGNSRTSIVSTSSAVTGNSTGMLSIFSGGPHQENPRPQPSSAPRRSLPSQAYSVLTMATRGTAKQSQVSVEQRRVSMKGASADSRRTSVTSSKSANTSHSRRASTSSSKVNGCERPRRISFDLDSQVSESDGEESTEGEGSERPAIRASPRRRMSETDAKDLLPSKFNILSEWQEGSVKVRCITRRKSVRASRSFSAASDLPVLNTTGPKTPWLWHPHSHKRLIWDLVGLFLLAYDLVIIPFRTAFNPTDNLFYQFMIYSAIGFWTADMVISFRTGYQERNGAIVMSPMRIAMRYMSGWFWLDTFLVSFDYLMVFVWDGEDESEEGRSSTTQLTRSLRTLRFLRSLRLLRLLKLMRIFKEIQDNIDSEVISTYWGIFKITVLIVTANHVIACVWYSIGISSDDGSIDSQNWVRQHDVLEQSTHYRYTTAMHWSLTQFTPASMEVYPHNASERFFTVIVVLFAMVTFSSFVSSLTTNMTHLRNRTANETRQFWLLRRYLKDLNISKQTSLRVQRYLEFAWKRDQARVQERDVTLLALLSQPLAEEIKHESFAPHLEVHALFDSIGDLCKIFTPALNPVCLCNKDLYFTCGQQAYTMLFVVDGMLSYLLEDEEDEDDLAASASEDMTAKLTADTEDDTHPDDTDSETIGFTGRLGQGDWICEAALWTNWVHVGDLEAQTDCQLITIDSPTFGELVKKDVALWYVLHKYAGYFVQELNQVDRCDLCDLTDRHFEPKTIIRKIKPLSKNRESMRSEDVSSNIGVAAANLWLAMTGQK